MIERPRILISTGEVSGDVAAAWLVGAVRSRCPQAELFGLGGTRMARAGVEILLETCDLGSVGLTEPLSTLPGLVGSFLTLRRAVREREPDVAILAGHEVFNWLMAWYLALRKVPTVCLFPPQIWLWGSLLRIIAPAYTMILSSFPEEHELYSRSGGNAHFVGHYLSDLLTETTPGEKAAARRCFEQGDLDSVVALLPGSRVFEIRQLAPLLLRVAGRLTEHSPRIRFVLPVADRVYLHALRQEVAQAGLQDRVLLTDNSRAAMQAADLAIMASGTASLEAALSGLPMILVYRISRISMFAVSVARLLGLVSTDAVGLPNLILKRRVVSEFRQRRASADRVTRKAWKVLSDADLRNRMRRDLAQVGPALAGELERESAPDLVLRMAARGRTKPAPPTARWSADMS